MTYFQAGNKTQHQTLVTGDFCFKQNPCILPHFLLVSLTLTATPTLMCLHEVYGQVFGPRHRGLGCQVKSSLPGIVSAGNDKLVWGMFWTGINSYYGRVFHLLTLLTSPSTRLRQSCCFLSVHPHFGCLVWLLSAEVLGQKEDTGHLLAASSCYKSTDLLGSG